mgnify:CR=1 FL=1
MDSSVLLAALGAIIGVIALMYLAYKGLATVLYTTIAVVIVCLFSGINLIEGIFNIYAMETGKYLGQYLFLFITGAVFGRIYQSTGAAASIANALGKVFRGKSALIAIVLATVIMGMAGISGFILIFTVFPIGIVLFQKANINKRLFPAIFATGAWTIANCMPGSTQIHNVVPTRVLGTSPMAGWEVGIPFAVLAAVINILYVLWENKRLTAQGIVFDSYEDVTIHENASKLKPIPFLAALFPIVLILVLFNVLNLRVEIAVFIGDIVAVAMFWKRIPAKQWLDAVTEGSAESIRVLVDTAIIVGFGAVIIKSPLYDFTLNWVSTTNMNPYLLAAIAANLFALIMGSCASAVNLVMQSLGPVFLGFAEQGYNLGFIHRIVSQAATGLDTLPHCGALLTVFGVCHVNHKLSYRYVFVCTVLTPLILVFLMQVPLANLLT